MKRICNSLFVTFAALAVLPVAVPCARADLVGYWTFEDSVADLSGSGNHGTLEGDPAYVIDTPGVLGGKSLALDGAGDYVNVTQNSNLPISSQPAATISMWVKGAVQKDMRIFSEGSSASNTPLYNLGTDNRTVAGGNTGAFDLFVRADTTTPVNHAKSVTPVFDESWHHIAFVDISGQAQLYVDGVLDAKRFNYTDAPLTADLTSIGAILRSTGSLAYFTGNIDDTAIWNSAINPGDIAALAAGASPQSIVESTPQPGDVYKIDIDSRRTSGTVATGPIITEDGWNSLDATDANGSFVALDGIAFSIGSADGSRIRLAGDDANPNPLTGDLIFDDGAGQALVFFFGGSGSLPEGTWRVDAYIYDAVSPAGTQIVGFRTNGVETPISDSVEPHATDAAISFLFESDGVSAYDLFVRENNDNDRSRLNAVELTYVPVPEPSTFVLLAIAMAALACCRRRR